MLTDSTWLVTMATLLLFYYIIVAYFLEMGCLCTKDQNKETIGEIVAKNTYSWDQRKLSDIKNFILEDLKDQEELKKPNSIQGQQFIIQNCKNSTIYVLDHVNTITIDDCINCYIIVGPIEGSAFIRNCKSCTCVLACGQFRVRDSTKINVFLLCATQPIIESSRGISFGTYQLHYRGITGHLKKAKLQCKNKNWKVIYDFTPVECEANWSFMQNDSVAGLIPQPNSDLIKQELQKLEFSWSLLKSVD